MFVPTTFLCNRCFYLLFNFKISIFLCFRNTLTPFSLDLETKMFQVLMILMFFLVSLVAFSA